MCLGALRGEHSLKVARRARAGQTFPQCCPIKSVRPQGEKLGWGCHFCPCQEKPQARGPRSAFPHEAGPQQGLLLGKVLSGSLQRIVLCMGWVSRAQGCVTAGSQHCRAQRTLCPTNTTCSNRIFCVHNYSLDTGGGGGSVKVMSVPPCARLLQVRPQDLRVSIIFAHFRPCVGTAIGSMYRAAT